MKTVELKQLNIENYKKFELAEYQFAPRTMVSGRNRQGKTTLMDAYFDALTGKLADGTSPNNVRRKEDGEEVEGVVSRELTLLIDGEETVIRKETKKGKSYHENYYIVLIHAVYDIPGKASDGTEMHDASEEIYEHILCSICPVNLSKAGLIYDVAENNIKDRIRDWVVSRPETGFLFPVFNDRSTDIHGTLYFNKNIKNIHPDFIENVLGAPIPRIPGNEINVFSDFIMDNFEGNTTFNFAESLVESLQEVREQKKDSPEMVTVSCDEMEQIFGYCGAPDEKLSDFKENWEMYFSNEPVALDNIHNSKTAKIVTPDATICIQPDKIALIELKEINGVPSLVIPVNGELKINGMEVELK